MGVEESECESGVENESECDGEDDDDSDDDLEIVGEESGTADSTGSSSGTEAPAKISKITLTVEQEKGVGVWYLYEIVLWLHTGNILRHTFRNN